MNPKDKYEEKKAKTQQLIVYRQTNGLSRQYLYWSGLATAPTSATAGAKEGQRSALLGQIFEN